VIGVLEKVNVDRGSVIYKGQVLATLKADVERAAAGVARSKAQAQADLQAAMANRDFNRQRLSRAQDLVAKKFLSSQALDQTRTEADVAEQRLEQAREQKRVWDHEHEMALAQLSLRNLVSPLSGVVVERYLSPGERVEDRPVLKIATMDPLRVEVFMPAASYRQVKPGMSATVYPELPDTGERTAKVTLVDQFIDPASNTFRVRLELANPNNELPSGLRCKVAIGEQLIGAGAPGKDPARAPIAAPATAAPSAARPPVPLPAPTVAPAAAAAPAPTAVPRPASALTTPPPATKPSDQSANTPAPLPAKAAVSAPARASGEIAAAVRWAFDRWQGSASKNLARYLAAYVTDLMGRNREARPGQPSKRHVLVSDAQLPQLADNKVSAHLRHDDLATGNRDDDLKPLLLLVDQGKSLLQEKRQRR
jgi:RND family efflux transporter MFP subunit